MADKRDCSEIYSRLLSMIGRLLGAASPDDVKVELAVLGMELAIYAPDEVVQMFNVYREKAQSTDTNQETVLVAFSNLMLAMREDIMSCNTSLTNADMLDSFVIRPKEERKDA